LLKGITSIETPRVRKDVKHSYHLYVIKAERRDALAKYLKENGIDTAIHYPIALHNMNAYHYLNYTREDFPLASYNEDKILSLPMFPELTQEQMTFVATKINEFFEN
jgi:dTDP-4-amino-4,6-dideoxygalactose transaminase